MILWKSGPRGPMEMYREGWYYGWNLYWVGGGYKYWTLDFTHHHSLSLSSLLQRWVRLKVVSIDATLSPPMMRLRVCYYNKEVPKVTRIMHCLKCQQISQVKKEVFDHE